MWPPHILTSSFEINELSHFPGGTSAHARNSPARRLHHPAGRHLRAHRGGAHPYLWRDARRQLRARRVPHAGHVSRLLGVRAPPARPLCHPCVSPTPHLRRRVAELPP